MGKPAACIMMEWPRKGAKATKYFSYESLPSLRGYSFFPVRPLGCGHLSMKIVLTLCLSLGAFFELALPLQATPNVP
jgi:hypothetical protein